MTLTFDERKAIDNLKSRFATEQDCMAAFGITGKESPEELRSRFGSAREMARVMGFDSAITTSSPRRGTAMTPRLTYDQITSRNRYALARDQASECENQDRRRYYGRDQEERVDPEVVEEILQRLEREDHEAYDRIIRDHSLRLGDRGRSGSYDQPPPFPGRPMPGEGPPPTRPVDDYGNDAYHRRFMQASRDQHRRVTDDRHRAIEDDYNRARGIGAHDQALEVRDFYSRFPETRRIGVQG